MNFTHPVSFGQAIPLEQPLPVTAPSSATTSEGDPQGAWTATASSSSGETSGASSEGTWKATVSATSVEPGEGSSEEASDGTWKIVGSWSLGERLLLVEGTLIWTSAWFHFLAGGEVILSTRCKGDPQPTRTHGRWWLEGAFLRVTFSTGSIRSPVAIRDEVLMWAGEILVRQPELMGAMLAGPSAGTPARSSEPVASAY